jgi:Flp pilus assembly protein TadG
MMRLAGMRLASWRSLAGNRRGLLGDRRGSTIIEFAVSTVAMFSMCFAILEVGLMCWTQNAMQNAATLGARCAATSNSACANVPQFVVDTIGTWLVPDSVAVADVTVQSAGVCNGSPGTAVIVSISHQFWGALVLPPPFSSLTINVSSCYAVGA